MLLIYVRYYCPSKSLCIQGGPKYFFILLETGGPTLYLRVLFAHL